MSDQTESACETYRRDRSEAALCAMMEAHTGQIYAVALRRCGGRVDWARDATQAVFRELAGKAGSLPEDTVPGGWLHRCALFKSSEILRSETRRRKYERAAAADPGLAVLMTEPATATMETGDHDPVWGALDGPAALDAGLKHGAGGTEDKACIMAGWSSRDPQAAMDWLEKQTSGPWANQKEILAGGIANGLSLHDPEAAGRWIESRPASDAQLGMTEVLIRKLVTMRGVQGAVEWFENSGPHPQEAGAGIRRRAFDEITAAMARSGDLSQAVNWLERHAEEPCATTGHAAFTLLETWAETDGAAAADWAAAHPGIGMREGGRSPLGETVSTWAKKDPNAVGQWLAGKRDLPGYDAAAVAFSSTILEDDPESALAWADTIRDPGLRADRRLNTGIGWITQTPADKQEALKASLKSQGVDIDAAFRGTGKP